MNQCIHESSSVDSDVIFCSHEDNACNVPVSFCQVCPFFTGRTTSKDFFEATSQLLVTKQRLGEYETNPNPCGGCKDHAKKAPCKGCKDAKPCKGCLEVKRRDESLQFVWPYWYGGASGDEIRFSVRSVEKFFQGKAKCLIIGDKPPWYSGPHLKKNRIGKDTNHRRFRDTLSKLYWMATRPEVDNEFIWMMDDIYFLKPFSVEDIQQPRAEQWGPSEFNSWQRRKTNTMATLAERERTTHDYATHMPHHVEKEKLAALFEEFNLHENTLLWEVLYGNTHREQPIGVRPFFRRFQTPRNLQTLRNLTKKATVMNHTSGAWSPEMREFLMEVLPDMATCEAKEGQIVPTFKKQRVVKRRPATVTIKQEMQLQ